MMMLLSILTCGIYGIYFWWVIIDDANTLTKDGVEEIPAYWKGVLFTFLTCGIYAFIWYYKIAENQRLNGEVYKVSISESGMLYVILMVFSGLTCGITSIVMSYLIIKNHNRLVDCYNANVDNVTVE